MDQQVQLIVFDIAGTTVKDNGEIAQAFAEALYGFGYEVPLDEINPLMGYRKTEAIAKMLERHEPNKDRITKKYVDKIHEDFLQRMVAHYRAAELTPIAGAEELFALLQQRHIKVALDTGFSKEITDVIINRLGWLESGLVDAVVSSSEVPSGRPFPYMIEELMRRTGVQDAKKVIKIGDTEVDIYEGKNAGCLYSIGVTTGAFSRDELLPHQPSFIFDNLHELLPLLKEQSVAHETIR